MESLDPAACLVDDLFDFGSDIDDDKKPEKHLLSENPSRPLHLAGEEELEWIPNKDAFPAIETIFVDAPGHPGRLTNHQSPVSVLENSNSSSSGTNGCSMTHGGLVMYCYGSLRVPAKPRSKCLRRFRHELQTNGCFVHENSKRVVGNSRTMGRKCQHCCAEKTPQWRAGPLGPKTLCNACGVRYKSGRLCDEYRPASSPTFSNEMHSNSHRKIIEMRQNQQPSMSAVKPVDQR